MAALDAPCDQLTRALAELARSRAASAAWNDAQRAALDKTRLDTLADDGRRLLQALQRGRDELAATLRQLA